MSTLQQRIIGLAINLSVGSAAVLAVQATQPSTPPGGSMPPATQPSTQPMTAAAPATRPTAVSVISSMDTAYAKLSSAQFAGHIVGDFDVAGEQHKYDVPFTSTFAAPNQFRHEADILIGSTGTRVYSFLGDRDEYQTFDAPKARAASTDWPAPVVKILAGQNPSLLLAMCKSAATELQQLSKNVSLESPTLLDGISYNTLQLNLNVTGEVITLLVNPTSNLLRQVRTDQRKLLEKQGATDVKSAVITIDYTRVETGSVVAADQFAWTAPAGAVQSSVDVALSDGGDGLSDEIKELIGKPASDFSLNGMDDKPVTLSAQKGSVVVLDFWATWCGPCVASLPHLNSLYKEQGPNGLKVFALDQRELKPLVSSFVTKKGWEIPILLDSTGSVAGAYKVTGIPQTVVIGKNGVIKQIFVGSGHEKEIAARVALEMR